MKLLIVSLVAVVAVFGLAVVGCAQATPAPAPTTAPAPKAAEPTRVAAPTTAPARPVEPTRAAAPAQPSAAPAAKATYPEKGRTITIIAPWPAGNANDLVARLIADFMQRELGTPVVVVNKAGASTQVGLTELVQAKPDGYTLLVTSTNTTVLVYLDEERKAIFGRKDFQPVAVAVVQPMVLSVKGDGPYKSTKDLVDAAKANPGKVTVSDAGVMTPSHLLTLALGKEAGVKFAPVHFDGGSNAALALLSGNVEAGSMGFADALPHFKSGAFRVLGLTDRVESEVFPGVKTLPSQGYNVVMLLSRGMAAPAGTPKEIVEILAGAIRKATQDAEFKKKLDDLGLTMKYMDTAEYTAHWDELDAQTKPMLEEAKAEATKK